MQALRCARLKSRSEENGDAQIIRCVHPVLEEIYYVACIMTNICPVGKGEAEVSFVVYPNSAKTPRAV